MATFTVRVELRRADSDDYDQFHDLMEREGFSRQITVSEGTDEGTRYYLPAGEYTISGQYTRTQILHKAKAAARRSGKGFALLVTESKGRAFHGLEEADD
jgi:hypothetical protein